MCIMICHPAPPPLFFSSPPHPYTLTLIEPSSAVFRDLRSTGNLATRSSSWYNFAITLWWGKKKCGHM